MNDTHETPTEPRDRLLETMLDDTFDPSTVDLRARIAAATDADRRAAEERVAAASTRRPRWLAAAAVVLLGAGAVTGLILSERLDPATGPNAVDIQDPGPDGWTGVRPKSVRAWRALLRDVTGATVEARLLPMEPPGGAPKVRIDGDRLKALCNALAACRKAPFEAGWIWPNHIRLELPGKRFLSCAWLSGDASLFDVAGLGDFHTTRTLNAILRPAVASASWEARRRAGVIQSIEEARRIGAGGLAADTPRLNLQGASDAMLEEIARNFTAVRELTVGTGRREVTSAGMTALARMKTLEVLHLRDCAVGDAGVAALAALPALRELHLGRAGMPGSAPDRLTGTGFAAFEEHRALRVIDLSWAKALTDKGLAAVAKIPGLESLNLEARRPGVITAAGLGVLGTCASLRDLNLSYCPLDVDQALDAVGRLPHLTSIDLSGTSVSADGLTSLAQATTLQSLSLQRCKRVDDDALAVISSMRGLRSLRLRMNAAVTDAAILSIGVLTELRTLELSNMKLGTGDLAPFANLRHLEKLAMSFTRVEDDGVTTLAKLQSLRDLDLAGCGAITPASVQAFAKMRGLRKLSVNVCDGLDRAACDAIRTALPDTEVSVPSEFR